LKKIINFIVFFVTIYSFAQSNNKSIDFEFYKNGGFKNLKNIKFNLLKNLDTVTCEFLNEKIIIPEIQGTYTVIVEIKNKKYKIENVDFSKLDMDCKIVFGIENNIENFEPISNQYPNFYGIKKSKIFLKIEQLEQAKKVYFLVFTSEEKTGSNTKIGKSYAQYFLVKKD
jgi:hypothetical protein